MAINLVYTGPLLVVIASEMILIPERASVHKIISLMFRACWYNPRPIRGWPLRKQKGAIRIMNMRNQEHPLQVGWRTRSK